MMTVLDRNRLGRVVLGVLVACLSLAGLSATAAEEGSEAAEAAPPAAVPLSSAIRTAGLALAIAITMAATALATARVQAAVGAGGTGALAEKPELFTSIVVLIAIPETMVILGFVVAFLLYRMI
jgi:V/A-type H+-transporting ATPase subunit K